MRRPGANRRGIRGFGGGILLAPAALTAPTFAGVPVRGQLLTGTAGTYSGVPAPVLTYQWQRDGGDIAAATSITYTLVSADDAKTITLDETATNAVGTATQTSGQVVTYPAWLIDSANGWGHAGLGVTDASGEVTDWASQAAVGSAWDSTQVTAGLRPNTNTSALVGGKDTIHYDGGDVLGTATGSHWEISPDGTDCTIYALYIMDSGTGFQDVIATPGVAGGGLALEARSVTSSRANTDDGPTTILPSGPVSPLGAAATIAMVYTGAVSVSLDSVQVWVDGVGGTPATGDQGAIVGAVAREVLFGAGSAAAGSPLIGDIVEWVYYLGLVTAQQEADLIAAWNDYYTLSITAIGQ